MFDGDFEKDAEQFGRRPRRPKAADRAIEPPGDRTLDCGRVLALSLFDRFGEGRDERITEDSESLELCRALVIVEDVSDGHFERLTDGSRGRRRGAKGADLGALLQLDALEHRHVARDRRLATHDRVIV